MGRFSCKNVDRRESARKKTWEGEGSGDGGPSQNLFLANDGCFLYDCPMRKIKERSGVFGRVRAVRAGRPGELLTSASLWECCDAVHWNPSSAGSPDMEQSSGKGVSELTCCFFFFFFRDRLVVWWSGDKLMTHRCCHSNIPLLVSSWQSQF